MDKHTKIILLGLAFLFVLSVVFAYFRFFVAGAYIIHTEISCDPAEEACFVYECDPETEECTGDPEEDTWYYKLISKRAVFMPVCGPDDEECPEPTCSIGEADCEIVTCTEETLADAGEGIYCSDPADFQDEAAEELSEEEAAEGESESGMEEEALTPETIESEDGSAAPGGMEASEESADETAEPGAPSGETIAE